MHTGNCVVCECFGRSVAGTTKTIKFIVAGPQVGSMPTFMCADHVGFDTVCVDVRESTKCVMFRRDADKSMGVLNFYPQGIAYEHFAKYGPNFPEIQAPYTDTSAWNASTPPGFALVDNCALSSAMMQEAVRQARS